MKILSAFLAFLLFLNASVDGFVIKPAALDRSAKSAADFSFGASPISGLPTRSLSQDSMVLYSQNQSIDGAGRGKIILAFAVAACVWIFSIPPEFRRAHFCSTSKCVENRAACYDCVTLSEWYSGVAQYYKNGGGVQFDFSIDPATKKVWEEAVGIKK